MLIWILRLIYLIFLVCKTRHKFVYRYNLYIFYLYILYTDNKKIFLCIRLRDLWRNDIGVTGSFEETHSFILGNSQGKGKHISLSAFSTVTGLAHHGLKSQLALQLGICYMVLEIRRLSSQQDPLRLADSHSPSPGQPWARGGYCTPRMAC